MKWRLRRIGVTNQKSNGVAVSLPCWRKSLRHLVTPLYNQNGADLAAGFASHHPPHNDRQRARIATVVYSSTLLEAMITTRFSVFVA